MKIAVYAPLKPPDHPTPSGDRRIARLLIEALNLAGHEVRLASRFRSRDAKGDRMRQARIADMGERLAARLLRHFELSGEPPDLWLTYHLYYKAPDWIGPLVSAALGIPYIVIEASHAPKRADGPWDLGHRAVEQAVRTARQIICLNPNDRACLEPLASGKISTIAPFLNILPYQNAVSVRRDLSRAYALPDEEPWLLAVGMMRHGDKLASYQMLAAALLPLVKQPWRLLIAGNGPAAPDVRSAFVPLGNRVAWLGAVDENRLASVYKSVDFMAWPAVREAFGMALLEGQAAGLPVVAGNTDGVPAIVRDGETGLLPPPGDTVAFSAAITRLLDDARLREAMGLAARNRVLQHHSVESAARQLDEILLEATCHSLA